MWNLSLVSYLLSAEAFLVVRQWFTLHWSNIFALSRLHSAHCPSTRNWTERYFYLEVIDKKKHHEAAKTFIYGHFTGHAYSTYIYTHKYICIHVCTHIRGSNVTDVTCLGEKWKEQNQMDLREDFSVEQNVAPHSYLKLFSCPPACL